MHNLQSRLAYLALEHLIVTLALKPGALVTERRLIELAGHGRTPVREAIQKLAWQGLILVRPRVGLQIASIGQDDHAHVMQVRRELEPMAAELVATHADAAQRLRLNGCAQMMLEASGSGEMAAFFAADKMFDELLEEACPNAFITSALGPVQTHSRRLWYSTATPERMDQSIALHVDAIHAIRNGQAALSRDAMIALIDYLSAK